MTISLAVRSVSAAVIYKPSYIQMLWTVRRKSPGSTYSIALVQSCGTLMARLEGAQNTAKT